VLLAVVCLLLGQASAMVPGPHAFWHDHEQPHSHARVLDHHVSDLDSGGLHQHVIAVHDGDIEACRASVPSVPVAVVPAEPQVVDVRGAGRLSLQPPLLQEWQRPNAPPGEVPSRAPPLQHG
jgi:hypothetical protein